jgi:DNA-directed RNA polymerase subunit F
MRLFMEKKFFEMLEENQSEGRTRVAIVSTFPEFKDDIELEVTLVTNDNIFTNEKINEIIDGIKDSNNYGVE